ncbi:MAG: hypothetical protein ACRDRZ_04615, partial [Pseudonocardiaceae bacterium]
VGWFAQGLAHARAARAMGATVASAPAAPAAWMLIGVLFLDAARRVRSGAMRWKDRSLTTARRDAPGPARRGPDDADPPPTVREV